MSDTTLKPCPFCGNAPQYCGNRVECIAEICPIQYEVMTVEEWNTRTQEAIAPTVTDEMLDAGLETFEAISRNDAEWSLRKALGHVFTTMLSVSQPANHVLPPVNPEREAEVDKLVEDFYANAELKPIPGRVLVPVEPTEAMIDSFIIAEAYNHTECWRDRIIAGYKAMLSAAQSTQGIQLYPPRKGGRLYGH